MAMLSDSDSGSRRHLASGSSGTERSQSAQREAEPRQPDKAQTPADAVREGVKPLGGILRF